MLSNIKLKLNSEIRIPVKRHRYSVHRYSVIGYFDQLSINRKLLYILILDLLRMVFNVTTSNNYICIVPCGLEDAVNIALLVLYRCTLRWTCYHRECFTWWSLNCSCRKLSVLCV